VENPGETFRPGRKIQHNLIDFFRVKTFEELDEKGLPKTETAEFVSHFQVLYIENSASLKAGDITGEFFTSRFDGQTIFK
jgi:hypothetical protein